MNKVVLSLASAISLSGTQHFHQALSCARLRGGPSAVEGSYSPDDVAVVSLAKDLHNRGLSSRAASLSAGSFSASKLARHDWVVSITCDGETIYPYAYEDHIPIGEIYHVAKHLAKLAA